MQSWLRLLRELAVPIVAGAALVLGWLLAQFHDQGVPSWLPNAWYAIAYLVAGVHPARAGLKLALRGRFDIDFLMVVAAIGAAAIGEVVDGGLLLFLFSLGHALEHYAIGQARHAISALGRIAPRSVRVLRSGGEVDLPVEQVAVGEVAIVRPGERIAVDGRVRAGKSAVDQSPMTGESIPIEKSRGDEVFAGTINGDGALELTVLRAAADTTMARMIRLVEEAQAQKSRVQRAADRFTRVYVPIVLAMVAFVAIVPPLAGWIAPADDLSPWKLALLRAIALLVGASPCALAISTPAAVLAGVAKAARTGVLIKGGAHLESLALIRAVALDKTGTITPGRPVVTDIVPFDGMSEERVLALAAALESQSSHPLSRAVLGAAEARSLELPAVRDLVTVRGKGLVGVVEGRLVRVGALRLFRTDAASGQGVAASSAPPPPRATPIPEAVLEHVERLERAARTVMLVAFDDRFIGVIALMDRPRPEAARAIARLKAMGVDPIVMLTGDNAVVAQSIARELRISDVRAGLLPEDKIAAVVELAKRRGAIAMVGDGVNDAPALAAATVGIAMGGGGTDVALEAADVALIRDDLERIPFALALGRAARRIVLQNVTISMGMVGLLIPLAIIGWLPITLAVILHEGSTVAVVLNGLRLLAFRDPTTPDHADADGLPDAGAAAEPRRVEVQRGASRGSAKMQPKAVIQESESS